MILFLDDWQKYPNAIADTKTKNQSFVRLAAVYKTMGIKNHAFILALHNPTLQGIDPHDVTNLSIEQMAAIAAECFENPWYFFREVVRAPGLSSTETTPLLANRGNIALFWLFFNHIMMFLIQPRQTGKSFNTDALMTLLLNVLCQNTAINLMTKNDDLRRKNVQRLKDIALGLPYYLRQKTSEDVNNLEEITVKRLGNTYNTHVPQASEKLAANMGRGLTSGIFHIDEGPFQSHIAVALKAALPAGGAVRDAAKLSGAPYGTIFTTTAGKKDDRDGKYIYKMVSESAIWTEKFLDARNLEELEQTIRRNSRSGAVRVNITMSHRQLGKTDEWLKTAMEEAVSSGDDADRDYFNIWTSGSQTNPLPIWVLEKIARSCKSELYNEISKPHGYITRWYIPEEEIEYRMNAGRFVMGMDTSEASGGDDISLVLVDVETLEVIGCGTYNETNLFLFANWVCQFLVQYKNVTGIIERRSTGAMLIDFLLIMLPQHGEDPFRRLFNWVVNDSDERKDRFSEINIPMGRRPSDITVRYKTQFGFATSGTGATSRTELYSTTLQNAAKQGGDRVHDKGLIDQITGLTTRNGRIDHEKGEHDDLVIGWLLIFWLITLGKNLSFYGIDDRKVMSAARIKTNETNMEAITRIEQDEIRERMDAIYDQLTNEVDDYVSMRLEHELRALDKRVILAAGEVYSLDNLIRQAKESKKTKRRNLDIRGYNSGYQDTVFFNPQGEFSNTPIGGSRYR